MQEEASRALVQEHRLDDDDLEEEQDGTSASPGTSWLHSNSTLVPRVAAESAASLAEAARERFRWLCAKDQKTVCRRECQLAQKREREMLLQLQKTIERYQHVLLICTTVASSRAANAGEGTSPSPHLPEGITPELLAKYEERIRYLQGVADSVMAEPPVSLPRLTVLEQAKGFAFVSYAKTAQVANKLKETTAGATAPALDGARSAFASLASRLRGEQAAGSRPSQVTTGGPALMSFMEPGLG